MQLKHVPVDLFSYTDETNCNTRNISMQNIAALKLSTRSSAAKKI